MTDAMLENLCQWVAGWIVIWWVCKLIHHHATKD